MTESEKGQRKKLFRRLAYIFGIVILLLLMYYGISSYPFAQAVIKLTAMKLFPVYKWIDVTDECLIRNPLYLDQYITEEDCLLCKHIDKVERVPNLTTEQFVEDYLKKGSHVIVENGIKDWPEDLKSLSIQKIKQAYQNEPALVKFSPCDFTTSLPYGSIDGFLWNKNSIEKGYYMSWTNCVPESSKALRRFYRRPYFLPSSVETFDQNFLFLSKRYTGNLSVEFKTDTALIILQQVKGSSTFYLLPEEQCNSTCIVSPIEGNLKEGEVLIAMNTNKVWLLEIQGTDEEENITIGIEGHYN